MRRPSLFRQNVMLLVGVVFSALVLAGLSTVFLVARPQVTRIAKVAAHAIDAMTLALDGATPQRLDAVIAALQSDGEISILVSKTRPETGVAYPRLAERYLMQSIADQLSMHQGLYWITDESDRLWIGLEVAGTPLWLTVVAPRIADPLTGFIFAFALSFLLALSAGIVIQRRIARPLEALANKVQNYRPGSALDRLAGDGPAEIANVARALNLMSERMETHETERSVMLAGVSHDLGTPLTRLRLALEMLRGREDTLVDSAERQVDQLERMLKQFLDYARGFEAEPFETINVRQIITAAVADAAVDGDTSVTADETLTAVLRPGAFHRALVNLLANAARHGEPPVSVSASVSDALLHVGVCDCGAGMTAEEAKNLTRAFARGDPARGSDGTGLGLAIADRVATAHGGTLHFKRSGGRFCAELAIPYVRSDRDP